MKKLILSSIIVLGSFSMLMAQSKVASGIYQEYADKEDVLAMSLNYDLIDILDMDLDMNDHMKHVSGDIYQVKFILFGDETEHRGNLKNILKELSSSALEEIEIPEDADDSEYGMVRFFGEKKGSYYSDICMILISDDGETGLFIAVNGKIKIRRQS